MIIVPIGILGDAGRIGWRLLCGEIVQEQCNHRFRARHQPGRINPEIEVIFHIVHGSMHPLVQPFLQPPGVFVQRNRPGDTTMVESQLKAPLLDQRRMFIF
jgi:hypothetical protein